MMSQANADVVIRAEKISMIYPGTIALNEVDYQVYRGKVNVIIGENGAGKSTLMKILAGVQQPSKGTIYLSGQRGWHGSPRVEPVWQPHSS